MRRKQPAATDYNKPFGRFIRRPSELLRISKRRGSEMNVLCILLIWNWLVAYWLSEYRRKKRDQAKA